MSPDFPLRYNKTIVADVRTGKCEMSSRREFLNCITAAELLRASSPAASSNRVPIKAVAFDALAIFDARPVFLFVEKLFPGKGAELASTWRTRQFEYMWLRSLSHCYTDFLSVTADALVFAAKALNVELTNEKRSILMDRWLQLPCWPDVPAALHVLKTSGLRIGLLSNMTEKMLGVGIRSRAIRDVFDEVLSTDRVRAYKPDPRAYHMGIDAFRLRRQEIVFVASAGWDAAGASSFGYRTFWVNRQNQPAEELSMAPVATGTSLSDLVAYITGSRKEPVPPSERKLRV